MAFYTDTKVVLVSNQPAKYQTIRRIGEKPEGPGIYKCQSCGFEDVMNRECTKLPPCSNCSKSKGANTWKLLVTAADASQ
ncbi:ribosomal protein L37AE/L43A [Pseudomonas sp. TE3786]